VKNLDYQCYRDEIQQQREYQQDWLKNGYAPRGFYLKDFCMINENNLYHLFHIAGTPGVSCCLPGNELWFGHATTSDFIRWETHQPCLYIDTNGWDNGHLFAPFVIKAFDKFWMFYAGVSIDNTQRIGAAISDDLFHWNRVGNRPLIRPDEYEWAFCPTENGAACRDPHLIQLDNHFHLYYTAVTRSGKGCVARASSKNLIDWKDEGPVFISDVLAHPESANVQQLGGQYLLFFGGQYEYWYYVVSDNPFDWRGKKPIALKKNITAMEVIERRKNRWLVSYFKMDNYRMFLGEIDWGMKIPGIKEISDKEDLEKYFLSA
ncbi:MAG TPA: hypothetical protein ENN22_06140, partial [bacterium]|nr:hypothetical protein [bacterium]